MSDREKIAEYLETSIRNRVVSESFSEVIISQTKAEEILALLKEQEAVEPDTDSEGTCTCGNCGETIGYYPVGCNIPEKLCKFCPECGRSVKWNVSN